MLLLQVSHLTKTFTKGFWPFTQKQRQIVKGISFEIKQGEILGLLGANGAGKTTTIQMLLGTLTPTSGSILYFGKEFNKHRSEILHKVSYTSGYDKLPARLTVFENLSIIGGLYNLSHAETMEQIESLLKFFGLWDIRHQETGSLSAGQATRMMLTKAFMPNPALVLLDEPTASLDPDIAHDVRQFLLKQTKERGTSLLLTSHNMDEVTEICDRVLVLKNGIIVADNTPEQLAAGVSLIRLHLIVTDRLQELINYLDTHKIIYNLQLHQIKIALEEQNIAHFLSAIAERKIIYSHISIDKPTLADYFLSLSKE